MFLSNRKTETPTDDLKTAKGFRIIYEKYGMFVYTTCFHYIKNDRVCDDLVSKIFLSLWERRESIEINGSLQNYLYKAAKLQVFDYFKLEERRKKREKEAAYGLGFFDNKVENEFWYQDFITELNKAIDNLPQQQQHVVRLTKLEGLSIKQTSQQLYISVNTVKTHLSKALVQLKKDLAQFIHPLRSTGS